MYNFDLNVKCDSITESSVHENVSYEVLALNWLHKMICEFNQGTVHLPPMAKQKEVVPELLLQPPTSSLHSLPRTGDIMT